MAIVGNELKSQQRDCLLVLGCSLYFYSCIYCTLAKVNIHPFLSQQKIRYYTRTLINMRIWTHIRQLSVTTVPTRVVLNVQA